MKKLWTGRTARQELVGYLVSYAAVNTLTTAETLESVFDGAEHAAAGSLTHSMNAYWDAASGSAQAAVLADARRIIKKDDKIMGRNLNR